jgi:hypothetical protein
MVPEDEENILPAYEAAWRSIPYDSETFAHMIAMGEIIMPSLDSHSTLSSCSSSIISDQEQDNAVVESLPPMCWNMMRMDDLCRVPSYATALRTHDHIPSSTNNFSLPTYESINIM